MARHSTREPAEPPTDPPADLFPQDLRGDGADPIDDEFACYDEPLARALDLDTWKDGPDLDGLYGDLQRQVEEAVRYEHEAQTSFRRRIFPLLRDRDGVPHAGVWRASPGRIEEVHRKVLFNGGVEACDGTSAVLETLPMTVTQVGVCLVSYQGDQGSWGHRMYRRDLRTTEADAIEEAIEILERRRDRDRRERDGLGGASSMARRGIMAYAERAVLLDRSRAVWRMGHGDPCPYELLTGSGLSELLRRGLDLMRRLVDHERIVFVPSETGDHFLRTIGNALRPLEYAIVDDMQEKFQGTVHGEAGYRGAWGGDLKEAVFDFAETYGRKLVMGAYRASRFAPAQVFYAHAEHAHEAALIALADSVLQEHRGFPTLIDLADRLCASTFGATAFAAAAQLAYAEAGEPFRYLNERQTRR